MRQHVKKVLALILSAALCMGLCIPAMAAGSGTNTEGVEFYGELDADTLQVSDQDQEVTLRIKMNKPTVVDGFDWLVNYGTTLSVKSVSNDDPRITITGSNYNANYLEPGVIKLHYHSEDAENMEDLVDLGTIVFTVPAGTVGEFTFDIYGLLLSRDYGEGWEFGYDVDPDPVLTITDSSSEETYVSVDGADVSYSDIQAKMETLSESTMTYYTGSTESPRANSVTATFLPISSLVETPAECGYTVAADGTSRTLAASGAHVYFDNGVLRSAVDGSRGNAWISGVTSITSVNTHSYVDGVCEICGAQDPNYTDADYTVSIARNGAGKVYAGDTVTMDVTVSGGAFAAASIQVKYDPTLVTYNTYTADTALTVSNDAENGVVTLLNIAADGTYSDGCTFASLTFTAQPVEQTSDAVFSFTNAKVVTHASAWGSDNNQANTNTATVTITKQWTVKFVDDDAETELGSYTVDDGESLTAALPADPSKDYHTFDGWYIGDTKYEAADIASAAVTADVTYTAKYIPNTYSVTLPGDGSLTGDAAATYNTDYEVTIANYDPDNYDYVVSYEATDGNGATVASGDVEAETAAVTIPGGDIKGNLTVTVKPVIKGIEVKTYADYVTGYTLVTVTGSAANGYSYDGNAMYFVERYTNETTTTAAGAYAWIVEGEISEAAAKLEVEVADGTCVTVADSYDVNGQGSVAFEDAVCVFDCYTNHDGVESNMLGYLRADVTGNHKVDIDDMSAILTSSEYID